MQAANTIAPMASQPFRLVQISDCHLAENAATPYRGKDADAGLQSLLPAIADWRPQGILLTGDVSEDASSAAYERVLQALLSLAVPICALPGNHDEDAVMRRYFPAGPWSGPYVIRAGAWQLVLLKTSIAGRIDGAINTEDIAALGSLLGAESKRPVLIALHHQPVAIDAAWIDRYMLQEPGELLRLLEVHEQIRGVVWGHVHQAFAAAAGHVQMLSCPSSAANSLPATRQFQHDPTGPACRWLLLHADGMLETGLLHSA
jgi:Icc protein